MAGKPTTVDELMEELEIKDLIIKRLNQNYAEMEREKDKWWKMYVGARTSSVENDEELIETRRKLKMLESRLQNVEKRIQAEYQQREDTMFQDLKAQFEVREQQLLDNIKADHEQREQKLLRIIENQNSLMTSMQESIPKEKKRFFRWFPKF